MARRKSESQILNNAQNKGGHLDWTGLQMLSEPRRGLKIFTTKRENEVAAQRDSKPRPERNRRFSATP
eukprot:scaffold109591_cov36-Phaeocystis_antarctica.AAC.1